MLSAFLRFYRLRPLCEIADPLLGTVCGRFVFYFRSNFQPYNSIEATLHACANWFAESWLILFLDLIMRAPHNAIVVPKLVATGWSISLKRNCQSSLQSNENNFSGLKTHIIASIFTSHTFVLRIFNLTLCYNPDIVCIPLFSDVTLRLLNDTTHWLCRNSAIFANCQVE